VWIAICDDDDSWDDCHLKLCMQAVHVKPYATQVISGFRRIEHIAGSSQFTSKHPGEGLMADMHSGNTAMTSGDFLRGNPGVQGSNMFVRLACINQAGRFDEALCSCTDRDLMVRLLDLPKARAIFTGTYTVNHFADGPDCSVRLSHPGLRKEQALRHFYAKHQSRMNADERTQCAKRAMDLFGCDVNISEDENGLPSGISNSSAPPESFDVVSDTNAEAAPRCAVLVGIIATKSPELLLGDLRRLQQESSEITYMDVILLDNGGCPSARILGDLAAGGLRVHVVTREEQEHDCKQGEIFLDDFADVDFDTSRSIATNRCLLQRYVYNWALFQGMDVSANTQLIVWILDDDKRLVVTVAGEAGDVTHEVPVRNLIAGALQVHEESRKASIVIGPDTGAPPIPVIFTLRTQLVDLVHNLAKLFRLAPQDAVFDRTGENVIYSDRWPDFFHDLRGSEHLETPLWLKPLPGESAEEMVARLPHLLSRMLGGDPMTRSLTVNAEAPLAAADSYARGGNTFIFDLNALRTPNAAPEHHRRSDFNFASLNSGLGFRTVSCPRLVVGHHRGGEEPASVTVGTIKEELCKALNDTAGYAFNTALRNTQLPYNGSALSELQVQRFEEEYQASFAARKAAADSNFCRVRGLLDTALKFIDHDQDMEWLQREESIAAVSSLRAKIVEMYALLEDLRFPEAHPVPTEYFRSLPALVERAHTAAVPAAMKVRMATIRAGLSR
jgi:hypothetical protein